MVGEVKKEPQEPIDENNQRIGVMPHQLSEADLVGVPCSSATAITIAQRTGSSNNPVQLPCNSPKSVAIDESFSSATIMALETVTASSNSVKQGNDGEWLIDLTGENSEMDGFVYDENFARSFGLLKHKTCDEIKQEFHANAHIAQLPSSSIEGDQKFTPPSSAIATTIIHCHDQNPTAVTARSDNNMAQQLVQDPISHHYQFEVDVCN